MNKFKFKISEFRRRILSNLKQVAIESLFISLVLTLVGILLFSNIVRVIATGKANYDTFLEELQSLETIKNKNAELEDEYNYVNSDEFKKLILRDTLGMADENERLYRTKEGIEYYDEELVLLRLRDKTDYTDWWFYLINN